MSVDTPLVSVLMVTYNSERFVKESIESVLKQTYSNFELVICDDNSQDTTWEIVNAYNDERIRKIRNTVNLREYPNRNMAVSHAKGEYLIFIDGDDLIYPYGLEFMMRFAIRYPECAMIISRPWDERILYPKSISPHEFYCFEYLDRGICGINFTKILFKASVIKETPFVANVKLGDVYIQYQIALDHSSVVIPDAATWWRRNPGQASERLLNDHTFYLMHELWIKLDMLQHEKCPLDEREKELAYNNLYGNLLRYTVKQIFKMKIRSTVQLLKRYPVPAKYIFSFLKPQYRTYFASATGGNPLHDFHV